MAADRTREETLTAASRAELEQLLATHRWLEPVDRPRRVPGRREWFVRVRAGVPRLAPAPRPRPRGRTIAAVAVGVAVVLAGVAAAVWWLLEQLAAHWAFVVGVLVLLAVVAAAVKRPRA